MSTVNSSPGWISGLTAAGELGILYMDGDGTDRSYVAAHRELKLATRSLIEDPAFQHSHSSHLVQFADLVAYAGYQHVLQLPEKRFAWPWYPSLSAVDGERWPARCMSPEKEAGPVGQCSLGGSRSYSLPDSAGRVSAIWVLRQTQPVIAADA